jgi:nicotinate-nucleotide adenylyltransferase
MKIGIFGGAFNPIHYGHLRSAEDVLERLSLDSICFIPSGTPAFSKPLMVSALHRYEMVRIAIEDNSRFSLSDIEVSRRGKSYSVDTLKKLGNKDRDMYFIIGIDAFIDLPGWKEPDTLVRLANLVVISRPGYSFSDIASSPYLKKVPRSIFREIDRGVTEVFSCEISPEKRCFLCRVTELNISASHIRSLLTAGMNVKYLLPDSVKSYIISHKLYAGSDNLKGEP